MKIINAHSFLDLCHPTLPVFDISDSDTAICYCRLPLGDARRTGLPVFKSNEQKQNNFRHARLGITTRNTFISLHLNAFIFCEQVLDPHAMSHRYLDEWNVLLASENVYFLRYYAYERLVLGALRQTNVR